VYFEQRRFKRVVLFTGLGTWLPWGSVRAVSEEDLSELGLTGRSLGSSDFGRSATGAQHAFEGLHWVGLVRVAPELGEARSLGQAHQGFGRFPRVRNVAEHAKSPKPGAMPLAHRGQGFTAKECCHERSRGPTPACHATKALTYVIEVDRSGRVLLF
jgi:hypothetical protein